MPLYNKDKAWRIQFKARELLSGRKPKKWLQRDYWLIVLLLTIIAFNTGYPIAKDVWILIASLIG